MDETTNEKKKCKSFFEKNLTSYKGYERLKKKMTDGQTDSYKDAKYHLGHSSVVVNNLLSCQNPGIKAESLICFLNGVLT